MSEEGPQQGDPLGSVEFCITIHDLLNELKSELCVGYLDDLTAGGPVQQVESDVRKIMDEAGKLGLRLNVAKCELISKTPVAINRDSCLKDFKNVVVEDMTLLGAPVTGPRAVETTLGDKVKQLDTALARLQHLHAHDALTILRHSLSIPKLLYTLRTANCVDHSSLIAFDNMLRGGLTQLLNVDLTDEQWTQASLPVRCGGLGFRRAATLASSAFLASAVSTREIQDTILPNNLRATNDPAVDRAENQWKNITNDTPPPMQAQGKQRGWDDVIVRQIFDKLLNDARTAEDKARLLAISRPHAGDWLLVPPISSVGLRMSDEEIRISAGLRLGSNICEPHACPCGKRVDARGLHSLACRKSAGRQSRHSNLNDTIWRALKRAGIQATKEPLGLLRNDGKRPDGVTLTPWSRGKCLAWDVTVPDTYAASHILSTSITPAAAADKAAVNKKIKYQSIIQTHIFIPIAVETAGVLNREATEFLQDLGRRMEEKTNDIKETAYLFQRISVVIQRGNAMSFAGTFDFARP
jgi:hypothetical protein